MNRHFHWLILLLVCHPLFANPIIVTYINEVQANPPSLQRIELHEIPEESSTTLNLSGYQIKTRAGVAIINSGVVLPAGGYVTIDATNTSGVFQINPICDTIIFRYNANSILDQVSWPYQPAGWRRAPAPSLNGSIALYRLNWLWENIMNWYIDSTPTLGSINDDWSSISGTVTHNQGIPAINHIVYASGRTGTSCGITNSLGQYTIQGLGADKYQISIYYNHNLVSTYSDSVDLGYNQHLTNINIIIPTGDIHEAHHSRIDAKQLRIKMINKSNLELSCLLQQPTRLIVHIYNLNGVLSKTFHYPQLPIGYHTFNLPLNLQNGIYFVAVHLNDKKIIEKLCLIN